MNSSWPARPASTESVKSSAKIRQAIDLIYFDLNRPENAAAWPALAALEPARTIIEIFDMVWWMHFRGLEPVKSAR
jgi:hypothetical protein